MLSTEAVAVERGIEELLEVGPVLRLLVADYLSDERPTFTGRHFHRLGQAEGSGWTAEDVAAPALLGTPIAGDGVEQLLVTDREHFAGLLSAVPATVTLLDESHESQSVRYALDAATVLVDSLRGIRGIGWTRAHKLVARKRPDLHPVYDTVVDRWFRDVNGIRYGMAELVAAGRSPRSRLRECLDPDRGSGLGELRLLDIAVWMCGSGSGAARSVRARRGAVPPPDRVTP